MITDEASLLSGSIQSMLNSNNKFVHISAVKFYFPFFFFSFPTVFYLSPISAIMQSSLVTNPDVKEQSWKPRCSETKKHLIRNGNLSSSNSLRFYSYYSKVLLCSIFTIDLPAWHSSDSEHSNECRLSLHFYKKKKNFDSVSRP